MYTRYSRRVHPFRRRESTTYSRRVGTSRRTRLAKSRACYTWSTRAAGTRSGGGEQHLADVAALLDDAVRLGGVRHREHPVDHRPDVAGLDQRPDVLAGRGHDRGLLVGRPGPQRRWRARRPACASAGRGRARPGCRPACRSPTSRPLVASTSRLRARYFAPMLSSTTSAPWPSVAAADRLDEVLVPVVDQHLGAELPAALPACRPTRRSRRPGRPSRGASWMAIVPMPELPPCTSRVSPGRSPASMKTFDHTVQVTSGSAAACTRSTPAGTGNSCPTGTATCSAYPPPESRAADLVADRPPVDPLAQAGDPAGALQTRVRRGAGRWVVVPFALQQVGPVDRGGGDRDEHLARAGDGVRYLLPGQDLGSTRPADHDGAHGRQP